MSTIKNAVICCAGRDSLMGLNVPKCLIPIEGKPLIQWQLDQLQDIENIVVVVGYQASEVMCAVLSQRRDAVFVINHEFDSTTVLESMVRGAVYFREPFIYLDGDLLVTPSAIEAIMDAPCPSLGITRTGTNHPICVRLGEDLQAKMVVAFTRESLEYEWTGLAKLSPEHAKMCNGEAYVYQAIEHFLPATAVTIECAEVDTQEDLDEARAWMRRQLASGAFGKVAAAA